MLFQPQGNKQQSSPESGDTMRYQTVVPVDQLQVRSSMTHDTHHHGFWELVHCKSETEGRPEKIFQLARYAFLHYFPHTVGYFKLICFCYPTFYD